MSFLTRIYTRLVVALLVGALLMAPVQVSAQCLPGLPCVTDAFTGEAPEENPNFSKTGGDEACDADFMNQIFARASIEAEREIALAGQNIVKPHSALQLSCFDKEFGGAAEGYISANFEELSGDDSSDACDYIFAVQSMTRCANADDSGPLFYGFQTLTDLDPRYVAIKGESCTGNLLDEDLVAVANNEELKHVGVGVFEDYTKIVNGDACADPVPTGVEVEVVDTRISLLGAVFFENQRGVPQKICVNPTCYYDPSSDSCKAY